MNVHRTAVLVAACVAAMAVWPVVEGAAAHWRNVNEAAKDEVIRLNREIFERVVAGRDREALRQLTHEQFLVIPPGGIVEDKAEALEGIEAFRGVTGVHVSGEQVALHGETAVVVGKVVIEGEVPPMGKVPPVRFMSVFVREGDQWRLLARSLTPCLPMVVQAGRC
jgi:ketosteroid isomerase-like protein